MNTPKQRLELKRKKFLSSQPQIKLKTCRVERSTDSEIQRFIIEGNPVMLGAVLPRIEIGDLMPLKMMASADGRIAVGIVKGIPKTPRVLVDYGFTKASCKIEETPFSRNDADAFKRITKLPVRRSGVNKTRRKIRKFLAGIFLKKKI